MGTLKVITFESGHEMQLLYVSHKMYSVYTQDVYHRLRFVVERFHFLSRKKKTHVQQSHVNATKERCLCCNHDKCFNFVFFITNGQFALIN